MHRSDPHIGEGLAPHAQANVAGRHMGDHYDAGWRGRSVGLHAHGDAARHVVDGELKATFGTYLVCVVVQPVKTMNWDSWL